MKFCIRGTSPDGPDIFPSMKKFLKTIVIDVSMMMSICDRKANNSDQKYVRAISIAECDSA